MSYKIDYDNLTITNDNSHGPKAIQDVVANKSIQFTYHLQYINEDGRIWYQAISGAEFVALELAMVEAPITADDVGMGVQI